MQSRNEIIVDSFVHEDFVLPVLKINPPGDFFLRDIRFSKRQMGHAMLAEWEQVCIMNHRQYVYEED